jgi:hypothetical protein
LEIFQENQYDIRGFWVGREREFPNEIILHSSGLGRLAILFAIGFRWAEPGWSYPGTNKTGF